MFIKASRKQRKGQQKGLSKASTLHRQLARGRAWRSRLFICSSVALGVSALAWLFDPSLTLHLALVGVGFLAGFAWPLGRSEPWALAWIDAQAGLSYRTALEREAHEGDPYGFEQALSGQVERSTKRLELPSNQPWWLPLLAVALSLAVLPALSWPGGLGGLGGGGGDGGAPLTSSEELSQTAAEDAASPEAQAEAANSIDQDAPKLERTFDAPGEDPAQAGGTNDDAQGEGQSADSETLERYLESLESQTGSQEAGSEDAGTAPSGAERNPFERSGAQQGERTDGSSDERGGQGSQGQSAQQAQQQGQDQGGQQSEADEARETREGTQSGEEGAQAQQNQQQNQSEPQTGQEGDGASSESPQETQGAQESESQTNNPEGSPAQQEQAQGEQQSAPGESEGSQEDGEQAGQAAQGDPNSPDEVNQSEAAQGGSPSSQAGEQEGGGSEGGAAEGAGNLPSAATPGSAERLATPPTGPERLEGERGAGVTNRAGETFAPGSDNVNIPGGRSAAEYSRAAEEAINEGRIPVEYQNILRDYFR